MAHTTFTNGVTLTDAAWFQNVDTVTYTLFGDGSSYTGALTLGSSGNIAVNTNKFTVAASSGNTLIAGTLGVTGALAANGGITSTSATPLSATAATPSIVLTDSTWSAASFLQVGVNSGATGTGNYFVTNVPTGKAFSWSVNNTSVATLSSTGLAVTGTIAATGAITLPNSISLALKDSVGIARQTVIWNNSDEVRFGDTDNLTAGSIASLFGKSAVKAFVNGSTIGVFSSTGLAVTGTLQVSSYIQTTSQVYPGDVAGGYQTNIGLSSAGGVPSNANGNNGDWCFGNNGHLYFKSGGAWSAKI